jgi:PBP1b-binding outer membrane lipoprotein LpoB
MKKLTINILFSMLVLFFASCEKYEAGGLISKTEKNLFKTWKLQQYLRNNTNETASILISNYEETYSDNNVYSRIYNNKDNRVITETGSWKLDTEQKIIQISGVSSIDITTITGTISASNRTITKLTNNEFWYTFINGGDKHEFRLIKK